MILNQIQIPLREKDAQPSEIAFIKVNQYWHLLKRNRRDSVQPEILFYCGDVDFS